MKAKAKKKRTKFVVAWAEYLVSEHKNKVDCGAFHRLYDTADEAHKAIMESIRYDAKTYLEEVNDGDSEVKDRDIDEFVGEGLWYNNTRRVKFGMTDIEYVYEVEEIEV